MTNKISSAGTFVPADQEMSPNPPLTARIGRIPRNLVVPGGHGRASPSVNAAVNPHGSCGIQRAHGCIPPEQPRDCLIKRVRSSSHPLEPSIVRPHPAGASTPTNDSPGLAAGIRPTMAQLGWPPRKSSNSSGNFAKEFPRAPALRPARGRGARSAPAVAPIADPARLAPVRSFPSPFAAPSSRRSPSRPRKREASAPIEPRPMSSRGCLCAPSQPSTALRRRTLRSPACDTLRPSAERIRGSPVSAPEKPQALNPAPTSLPTNDDRSPHESAHSDRLCPRAIPGNTGDRTR